MKGHQAKTGNAKIKKVGQTTGKNFGQNVSARGKGGADKTTGSELSYGK